MEHERDGLQFGDISGHEPESQKEGSALCSISPRCWICHCHALCLDFLWFVLCKFWSRLDLPGGHFLQLSSTAMFPHLKKKLLIFSISEFYFRILQESERPESELYTAHFFGNRHDLEVVFLIVISPSLAPPPDTLDGVLWYNPSGYSWWTRRDICPWVSQSDDLFLEFANQSRARRPTECN